MIEMRRMSKRAVLALWVAMSCAIPARSDDSLEGAAEEMGRRFDRGALRGVSKTSGAAPVPASSQLAGAAMPGDSQAPIGPARAREAPNPEVPEPSLRCTPGSAACVRAQAAKSPIRLSDILFFSGGGSFFLGIAGILLGGVTNNNAVMGAGWAVLGTGILLLIGAFSAEGEGH